jgi:hypothetical protein
MISLLNAPYSTIITDPAADYVDLHIPRFCVSAGY